MRRKKTDIEQSTTETTEIKKRPGRQPMTPEQKEAAAKLRAAEKEKADNLRPEVIIQFQNNDVKVAELVDAARADFRKAKKRTLVTDMKLYVKLEDAAAYYVINGENTGKVSFLQSE